MNKVMRIGTVPCGGIRTSLYCVVKEEHGRLSFTGVIGPLASGNAHGGAGQIDMEFAHRNPADNDPRYSYLIKPNEIKFAKGWTSKLWLDFLDAWKRWHLNDMKAGSKVQEDWLRAHPKRDTDWTQTSNRLARAGLNPDPDGYKYGSAWKHEEVPAEVLAFLQSLPIADRSPAWA
jgi:hypothetical protein